ncbi:hypothetical protein [Nonomuraea sp. NPDC049784]|uniref:hypothetical protein n=1 Tax=Nonomuraea sp. NPDC049784 TaxID=3154361 RepID=UPI0033CD79B3
MDIAVDQLVVPPKLSALLSLEIERPSLIGVRETDEPLELVERVAAIDIGKSGPVVRVRVPHDNKPRPGAHHRPRDEESTLPGRSLSIGRVGALARPGGEPQHGQPAPRRAAGRRRRAL